ncbi:hypothetical protein [Halocalculus aciditolerans]|uniref:Uncharacterized protein n=1 Tax=Halocalculus aciditolerans TaxID=1383812 RepID=A0A830FMW8_9EURY|nr:hypothetical protein [Halocalculus aciditolerans]GGL71600.1 hypothetical protein GCM10009039_32070 [Halocalculus aciditolerans]
MTWKRTPTQQFLYAVPPHFRLFLAVAGFVVVPALLNGFFGTLGYSTLGTATWILGYIGGAVFVWYYWLRHIDFLGSHAHDTEETGEE